MLFLLGRWSNDPDEYEIGEIIMMIRSESFVERNPDPFIAADSSIILRMESKCDARAGYKIWFLADQTNTNEMDKNTNEIKYKIVLFFHLSCENESCC